jgi:NADPH:quinone reductase-like Zn-dependent oxidoreductase
MLSMHLDCELWPLVCPVFLLPLLPVSHCSVTDTGAEKKELCLSLGAEKWIDFRETKDLVKDIKNATGGEGPHAALVSAASVSFLV